MGTTKNNIMGSNLASFTYLLAPFEGRNNLAISPRWLQNIAFFSLCAYVYAWYLFNDFASTFSILLTLIGTYLLFFKRNNPIPTWRNPAVLLFIAAIIIQLFSWVLAHYSHPELSNSSPKVHRMGIWFKMIPIAIILGGCSGRVMLCWLLTITALFSATFITGEGFSEWQAGLAGKRVNFGINNAQHSAMLGGICLLSIIAAFTINIKASLLKHFWFYTFLMLLLSIASAIVVVTQTRAIWGGLIVSIPLMLLSMLITSKQTLPALIKKSLAGAILISIVLFSFQDILKQRGGEVIQKAESAGSISQMLENDYSFSLRLATWKESIEWIKQKPAFGWGGDIEKHIVANTAKQATGAISFRHLHNAYLETLANYGIAGLTIIALLIGYLIFCAHKSWRHNIMPTPVYIFSIGFFPYWLIINISESYFYYSSGEYILAITGGVILSYYWRYLSESEQKSS